MFNRKILTKIIMALFLFALEICVPSNIYSVSAETTAPIKLQTAGEGEDLGQEGEGLDEPTEEPAPSVSFDGFEISTSVIADDYLYNALLKFYRSQTKGTDKYYTGTTIYSDMFKDFDTIILDSSNITSLQGLEKLDLDNLTTFSANDNNISSFSNETLRNINEQKFKSLSLACNELQSIDLTGFSRLTYLNLSCNKLVSINLSKIEGKIVGTDININLAGNNFASMKSIVLPEKRIGKITLNIIDNNITDIDEDKFFTDKYDIKIGVQGYKGEEVVSTDTRSGLKVYKTNIPNVAIDIYRIDGDEDEYIATIEDSQITDNFKVVDLQVGQYVYYYVDPTVEVANRESLQDKYDIDRAYLCSYRVNVLPQTASYVFVHKGKEYKSIGKVTGKVTVKLSAEDGAKIFYQINGGEWVEGNEIVCDKGGSYSIRTKTVVNGVESKEDSIWVRTSLNLYVPDALMFVLILLLTLVLFLVVLPIISKKYFKKD